MPDRRNLNVEVENINQNFNHDGTTNLKLEDLKDVLVTSVANGDVPTWNSGAGKWENMPGGGPDTDTLAADTDVTITSPAAGDLLKYSGTSWVNEAAAASSGAGVSMTPLTITGQTFSNGEYALTGAAQFQADQSFTISAGKMLVIKTGLRNSRVGAGGGGGFICKATVSGVTYQWGIDTLSTSAKVFNVYGASFNGGPSLPSVSTFRQFLTFCLFFNAVTGGTTQHPLILVKRYNSNSNGADSIAWDPGTTGNSWAGATLNVYFYVDDNATSSVEYYDPVVAFRSDGEWVA